MFLNIPKNMIHSKLFVVHSEVFVLGYLSGAQTLTDDVTSSNKLIKTEGVGLEFAYVMKNLQSQIFMT